MSTKNKVGYYRLLLTILVVKIEIGNLQKYIFYCMTLLNIFGNVKYIHSLWNILFNNRYILLLRIYFQLRIYFTKIILGNIFVIWWIYFTIIEIYFSLKINLYYVYRNVVLRSQMILIQISKNKKKQIIYRG